MKRLALPSTALLALVLAAGALAGASEPSTVTLELGPQPGYFSGKVKSDARTCKRNRRVVIKSDIDSSKVGSDRTNRRGRYGVSSGEMSGSWHAVVRRKVTDRLVCKSDRSPSRSAG